MPFYDYKCGSCGRTFEVRHGMSGKPAELKCEFCGSASSSRIFHPVGTMKNGGDFSDSSSGTSCSSCSSGTCSTCR